MILRKAATVFLITTLATVVFPAALSGWAAEGEPPGEPAHELTSSGSAASAAPDYFGMDLTCLDGIEEMALPPHDRCLPSLYRDWSEISANRSLDKLGGDFAGARVIIDRSTFNLLLQGIRWDLSVKDIYSTRVAIGDFETPTPVGQFIINHVYCYSDVLYFDVNHQSVPLLYNGFFAPLLACDEDGRCRRFRELGLHGFDASAYPNPQLLRPETEGPVSHGCIRLPDPCAFKAALIRLVGVGPLKRNERGSYHWLDKPVEVWIVDDEITLVSLMEEGFSYMHQGLLSIINWVLE